MQLMPDSILAEKNRDALAARTAHAKLQEFQDYCRQRVKVASAPSYFEHNAGGWRPVRPVLLRGVRVMWNKLRPR